MEVEDTILTASDFNIFPGTHYSLSLIISSHTPLADIMLFVFMCLLLVPPKWN